MKKVLLHWHKKDKVKTAKKIAKDMEKWAKTLNQRKEAAKASQPASAAASAGAAPSTATSRGGGLEDLAFSMLQKQTGPSTSKPVSTTTSRPETIPAPASGLARLANYGSDSDNDDQARNPYYNTL